jgi:hypothetical protein
MLPINTPYIKLWMKNTGLFYSIKLCVIYLLVCNVLTAAIGGVLAVFYKKYNSKILGDKWGRAGDEGRQGSHIIFAEPQPFRDASSNQTLIFNLLRFYKILYTVYSVFFTRGPSRSGTKLMQF